MKVLESTFRVQWATWHDPGPPLCGAGPRRPSYTYPEDIIGQCIIDLEAEDFRREYGDVLTLAQDIAQEHCPAQVTKWGLVIVGTNPGRIILDVEEFTEDMVEERTEEPWE